MGAIEQDGRREHRADGEQEQPAAAATDEPEPDRRARGQQPPRDDARPRRPPVALLPHVLRHEAVEAEQVERAGETRDDHLRELIGVLAQEVDGHRPLPVRTHRRLLVHGVGRVGDDAADRPAAELGSRERGRAGAAEERGAVVGRERHGTFEPRQVERDPRGDGHRRTDRDGATAHEPSTPGATQIASGAGEREHDHAHRHERQLAARQCGEPRDDPRGDERARARAPGRIVHPRERQMQQRHHGQHAERFRHDEAVVHPEVRIRRRDHGRDDGRAVTGR